MKFPDGYLGPPLLASFSRYACGQNMIGAVGNAGTGAWPAANRAIYIPLAIPFYYPVNRAWIAVQASAGNIDIGVYSEQGARIWHSGSTVVAGTTTLQFITPSPTFILPPGSYYLAAVCSTTTTATFGRWNTGIGASHQMAGTLQQASALPLPDPMTPVTLTTTFMPMFGLSWTTGF